MRGPAIATGYGGLGPLPGAAEAPAADPPAADPPAAAAAEAPADLRALIRAVDETVSRHVHALVGDFVWSDSD